MDPYETLGITPAYEGDLRALRNRLAKRYFEAGEAPDEERMKAINLAYELLTDPARPRRVVAAKPFSIATSALPLARVGAPYRAPLTLSDGAGPYRWDAVLPAGLELDAAGTIGGRPERAGSFPFTLTVTDRDGRTARRVLVLDVTPAPLRVRAQALPNATTLADEQHAAAVAAHEAGSDAAATRARIALLQARLARPVPDRAAIAAAILAAAALASLLSWLIGLLAGAALIYAIGPALLAPARRAELERLRGLLGCGRVDCARCRQDSAGTRSGDA
jgi:hypothetical protein